MNFSDVASAVNVLTISILYSDIQIPIQQYTSYYMSLLKQTWHFKSFLHAKGFDLCSSLKEMCVSIKETLPQFRKRAYKRDASRFTLKGNHKRLERARKVRNVKICLLILSSSTKRFSALWNMVLTQLLHLDS